MTMVTFDPQQLDRISLDDFSVTRLNGSIFYPHKGQSVWAYGYGRSAEDATRIQDAIKAAARRDEDDRGMQALRIICQFVVDECPKHDVLDPRTGQPYPPFRTPSGEPDPEAPMKWPDALLGYLSRKLLGVESEGEGAGGSGS